MNYKGEYTFNTAIGGCITLCVYALTLVMIVNAVDEIVGMHDPTLREYQKPMSSSEEDQWLPFKPSDYGFKFMLLPMVFNLSRGTTTVGVPPEIGTLMILNEGQNIDTQQTSLSDCSHAITDDNLDNI